MVNDNIDFWNCVWSAASVESLPSNKLCLYQTIAAAAQTACVTLPALSVLQVLVLLVNIGVVCNRYPLIQK